MRGGDGGALLLIRMQGQLDGCQCRGECLSSTTMCGVIEEMRSVYKAASREEEGWGGWKVAGERSPTN